MTGDLDARLDVLDATEGARDLTSRYALAYGRADAAALASLYSKEADEQARRRGGEPIDVSFEASMTPPGGVRTVVLHAGAPVITVEPDGVVRARSHSYGDIERGTGERFIQAIHYGDVIGREGPRWRFARHRRHELFYGTPLGQDPTNLPPARWPERDIGVGTLPHRWKSWVSWQQASATHANQALGSLGSKPQEEDR